VTGCAIAETACTACASEGLYTAVGGAGWKRSRRSVVVGDGRAAQFVEENQMTEVDHRTQVLPPLDAGPPPRARRRWPWVVAVAVVMAIGSWIWVRDDDQTAVRFKTQEVRRGDLTVVVTATGNLEPTNQVDVGSELSGTVKTVTVDFNDQVKVGQVLATLDTSKLDKQVQESRASFQVAQARVLDAKAGVMEARANLDRLSKMQKLGSSGLVSEQDLVTAQAAFARAEAAVASAKAQVAQAQANLDGAETDRAKAVIYSPINGIVLKRAVEPGQTVAASLQAPVLFTLAEDLKRMELHVDVDEADVSKVTEGQEATFTVDAYPERHFQARVAEVRFGSETVGGVVTYETVLKVDNTDLSLRPGMTATADIAVSHVSDVVLVPNAALRFEPPASAQENQQRRSFTSLLFPRPPRRDTARPQERASGSKQHVWVLQGGVPVAIPVTTGMTDGSMTQIISGNLSTGTAVIVDTATSVR